MYYMKTILTYVSSFFWFLSSLQISVHIIRWPSDENTRRCQQSPWCRTGHARLPAYEETGFLSWSRQVVADIPDRAKGLWLWDTECTYLHPQWVRDTPWVRQVVADTPDGAEGLCECFKMYIFTSPLSDGHPLFTSSDGTHLRSCQRVMCECYKM